MSQDRKEGFLDSYTMFREGATRKSTATKEEHTADLKRAGKFLGADAIGICDFDERWVYTHNYSRQKLTDKPMDLPEDLTSVVVIVNEMHHQTIQTVPSALSRRRYRAGIQPRHHRGIVRHPVHSQSGLSRRGQPQRYGAIHSAGGASRGWGNTAGTAC